MEYEIEERSVQFGDEWLASEPLDFFGRAFAPVLRTPTSPAAPDRAMFIPEQEQLS